MILHMRKLFLALAFGGVLLAEVDPRLTVNTYVREDIFAGFMANDMDRFAKGEKKLEQMLVERPGEKGTTLAWQAGATMFRAVLANKENRAEECARLYEKAIALFAEAGKLDPANGGLYAIKGGVMVLFADKLPEQYRAASWATAYESFQVLGKQQLPALNMLPLHLKGELLAGLAQSAQRTGRDKELTEYLDKMTTALAGTPYASRAQRWKDEPSVAAKTSLVCQSCHDGGRLEPRMAAIAKESAPK